MKAKSNVQIECAASYEAPMIEVIDIRLDQNILQTGSSPSPDTPGEVW
jgi:hypothetical protein